MIDAVVFDLDDTLCAYRRHGREVLAEAFERADVEPFFGIEDYYAVYEAYAGAADTIEAGRALCFAGLAEEAGRDPAVGRAVASAFDELRDHSDVQFLPGAREAVESLGAAYPLALVTNGAPRMQATKLEALGLGDAFATVVHGGHDAPAKPSPEPFHLALEAVAVEPDRAVHVGNSRAADVAGAKAAGLHAAWLEGGDVDDPSGPLPEPDYVLGSLHELCEPPWSA